MLFNVSKPTVDKAGKERRKKEVLKRHVTHGYAQTVTPSFDKCPKNLQRFNSRQDEWTAFSSG